MNIEFYQMEDGTVPAREFIYSLDDKLRAKVARTIFLLEEKGHRLRAPESKELTDGIMELRASFGGNTARVLYFFIVGNTAVRTNGFIKKTQLTPRREIERAKQYRADYLRRYNHGHMG